MARLSSGWNGAELLRVEREEGENKRILSFMSKGPVLEKIGTHIDGVWYSGRWRMKAKRNIGTELIRGVMEQFEAAGWRVTFWGNRKFRTTQEKRTLTRRNDTTKEARSQKSNRRTRRKRP